MSSDFFRERTPVVVFVVALTPERRNELFLGEGPYPETLDCDS